MNSVKFRAWHCESKTMYSWDDLINRIGLSESVFVETKQWKPMQFTGRKDWYVGDICTAEYRCAVCFDCEPHLLTGTIEQADNGLWMLEYEHGDLPLDSEDLQNIRKVGNRFENPGLLE